MRVRYGCLAIVSAVVQITAATAYTPAAAQWLPWTNNSASSAPPASEGGTGQGHAPSTLQSTLVSHATDEALGLAIERYKKIVAAGGWQPIPSGGRLKLGAHDERVVYLRRRLQAAGDLPPGRGDAQAFDREVFAAVQRFQQRNGLTPSGQVNSFTLRALNVSAQDLLHRLRLNRQKLRDLLTRTQSGRYILVNIPAYELQAVSNGQLELTSVVVVGKPATPTPEVSAAVRAVNFLPYWHVPQSIAQRALIPAVKKDPAYLEREHIRVFASWGGAEIDPSQVNWWSPQGERLVFRQDPGPFNALGLIRLDMPNKHIVYLHDTPLKKLFGYYLRPYSAGCVRVARIQDLALWVLAGEGGWNARRLADTLQAGRKQTAELAQPVPVHFVYISAWATGRGEAHFRLDIYDKDGAEKQVAQADAWEAETRVAP